MLESDTSTQRSSSAVLRYGLAVSSIAVALILTLLLHPDALQSPIFLLAIILSAVAAALATLAIAYFFLPPIYSLKLDPAYTPQLLVFFLSALLVSSWSAKRRRAEHALRRARDELEVKVQERTADLQALRDRLRLVIDTIPVMVWSALPDGSVDFVNQRWVEYHGFSMEDVDRQGWEAVAHPEDLARALDKWRAAVAAGQPSEHELRVRRADGEYRWFLSRAVPLRDELGSIVKWYGTVIDIEDRKRAEERLQQSEAYLSEAQRLSHTGSFGWSVATGEIIWSEETFRIFQYARTTRPTVELIVQRTHPGDRALVRQTIERASQDGKDFDFEHRLLMPDGSIKHLRVVGHAESDRLGEQVFVGAVMDVTAAKEAEERIRQNERELRIIIETIPTYVTSTLPDGSVDFVSQSWLDYLGCSREEMLDWGWMKIVYPEDLDRVLNNWQAALAAGKPLELEARCRRADGEYRWFLDRAVPLRDEKENIVKWYATVHDIEDRKRAEQKLRQSEAHLQEAQRLGHMGSLATNVSSGAFIASPEFLRIFGCDPDKEKPTVEMFRERIHPEDRPSLLEMVNKARSEKTDYELDYRIVLPDGSITHAHTVGHPVFNDSGDLVEYIGTTMDVTERKRAEEVSLQLASIVRSSDDAIVSKTLEGVITSWNPAAERMFGYTAQEAVGQPITIIIPADRLPEEYEVLRRLQRGEAIDHFETIRVRKDGGLVQVSLSVSPVRDGAGRIVGASKIARDVTEYRRAEEALQKAQGELAHVTRVATLGEMTASIAHEINQPLGAVVNSASACLRWLDAQKLEEARRSASRVIAEGHRASEIIARIRALAKKVPPRKDWLDVNETIHEVVALARSEVKGNRVWLQTQLAGDLPLILGDRIELQQVILNLMMNAIEALSGAGEGPRELLVRSGTDESQGILISVQDSGPGLDPERLDHLFDAFYTTKPHGLGMGLAISRSLIEAHGGRLWANAPHGAIFQFTLPIGSERVA